VWAPRSVSFEPMISTLPGTYSMTKTFYSRFGKRWLDAAGASAGLIILSPLFLVAALAIKFSSRGPVFFTQLRVGQFGKTFLIFKFRSMKVMDAESESLLTAAGDPRINSVGRWLRKTKADEFPQLINVFLGEMSLVGPRPEVPKYAAVYSERQRQVLLAKPGITGPAANDYVNEEELLAGQDDKDRFYIATLLPAKLEMDLAYCERVRFAEDLKIIFATFWNVFFRTRGLPKPLLRLPERQG
jgi:lipopolysaccharide/colanic/teichoic acid biosynthesis glycosyltransferase